MPDPKSMTTARLDMLERSVVYEHPLNLAECKDLLREVRRLKGREKKLVESLKWAMEYLDEWIVDDDMCDFCHRDKRTEKHKPTCSYRKAKERRF